MLLKRKFISGLTITALLLVFYAAQAIEIIIDKGVENPIQVAIVPFGWSQTATLPPLDLAAVVTSDLARSGRFAPMQEQDLPQRPTRYQQINFKDWRLLGMENLVIGQLKLTERGDYDVEFRLIDVYKGEQIAGFRIPSSEIQLRRTAHRISDIIFEKLIGIRGAFDTRIAYIKVMKLKNQTKRFILQSADTDGFNPQILLESSEPLMSPAWSPDGKSIAYVSFENRNSAVYVQNILTGNRVKVAAHPGINSAPAWSPDGTRLALTLSKDGNPEIYLLHLASRTLQRITTNRAIDTEPSWFHNGDKIAFTSDRGGSPQIYEVSVTGGQPQRLTFDGTYNARPRYSPDGKSMALIHGKNGFYHIALLDLQSGYLTVLTQTRLDESPSFAPNGSMIMYATSVYKGSELAAVSTDGRVHQRLTFQDGEVREPAWGPFPSP